MVGRAAGRSRAPHGTDGREAAFELTGTRQDVDRRAAAWCLLFVCACFTLTAEGWIRWHYHLMDFVDAQAADALALVVGYLLQAAGMGVGMAVARRRPEALGRAPLAVVVATHFVCAIPAAVGDRLVDTLAFGLAMCVLCGVIAASYLQALARRVAKAWRGRTFGGAYALSTVVTWLLSLAPATLGADVPTAAVVCAALSAATVALVLRGPAAGAPGDGAPVAAESAAAADAVTGGPEGAADNMAVGAAAGMPQV